MTSTRGSAEARGPAGRGRAGSNTADARSEQVKRYYVLHAPVYDLTRWTFLFGRDEAIRRLGVPGEVGRVLEIGCGTGRNLVRIAQRYANATITGIDLSPEMARRARAAVASVGPRVQVSQEAYGASGQYCGWPDVILCSYSLSMMGAALPAILDAAARDLGQEGRIVVVDFADSPYPWFRSWMRRNHVDVDGSVGRELARRFVTLHEETHDAYGGLWRWLLYVGRPR